LFWFTFVFLDEFSRESIYSGVFIASNVLDFNFMSTECHRLSGHLP